jgi:hypothetical protein
MTVKTRVMHVIEVWSMPDATPYVFEFDSRDIGMTQGTTITRRGRIVARYRPGTRHWSTALEVAQKVLEKTFEKSGPDGPVNMGVFTLLIEEVLRAEGCMPWNGSDPYVDDEFQL